MVEGFEPVFVGVELKHREIHHPEEVPGPLRNKTQLLGQVLAHPIKRFVHRGRIAGAK